jgi:polysaccharide biosynthesis protein PslH
MKILLLCNKSPYPAKEGGPIAMSMIIDGLIDAGHSVKVLAINTNKYSVDPADIPATYRLKTGLELVYVDLSLRLTDALLNLFSSQSYHVERFISKDVEHALIRILQSEQFDIVQFEMLYMSPYAAVVRKYSNARLVLRAHNIEHRIWKRVAAGMRNPLKRWYLNHLVAKLKRYECSVAETFDGIAAITDPDADFFRSLECSRKKQSPIPVITIPFGIDLSKVPETSVNPEFPSLFSIGSMDWIPNLEGIDWFLEKVWPEVHKNHPDLRYYVAGRHMPDRYVQMNMPNVDVVGEVEDAFAFIHSKAIMVVPLFSGSGIRIKIIEGMAAGKTIISTRIGAEGIQIRPGEDILIADTPEEFINAVSFCINNAQRTLTIGLNAKNRIQTSYNRSNIISDLVAFYQQIRG